MRLPYLRGSALSILCHCTDVGMQGISQVSFMPVNALASRVTLNLLIALYLIDGAPW